MASPNLGPIDLGFAGKNEAAQRAADRYAARLVTRVSRETRDAIRALIVRSIREGIPPYDAARMIRSMIGLSGPQAQAVASYRLRLINSGLSLQRVELLMKTFVARKLRERSITIARTEIMGALNQGALHSWQQNPLLSKDTKKEWIVTPDEKLCPVCAPMDGKQVRLSQAFDLATGKVMAPPAHPRCRCTMAPVPVLIPTQKQRDLAIVQPTSGPVSLGVPSKLGLQALVDYLAPLKWRIKLPAKTLLNPNTVAGQARLRATEAALESARLADEAMRAAGSRGNRTIRMGFYQDKNINTYAHAFNSGKIEINLNSPSWLGGMDRIKFSLRNDFLTGFHPIDKVESILVHEYGHVLNARKLGGLFPNSWTQNWPFSTTGSPEFLRSQALLVASRVSRYAQHSPAEFVAETFEALTFGKTYDDEVMKLYKALGGRHLHRTAYPGDHGVRWEPLPGFEYLDVPHDPNWEPED